MGTFGAIGYWLHSVKEQQQALLEKRKEMLEER